MQHLKHTPVTAPVKLQDYDIIERWWNQCEFCEETPHFTPGLFRLVRCQLRPLVQCPDVNSWRGNCFMVVCCSCAQSEFKVQLVISHWGRGGHSRPVKTPGCVQLLHTDLVEEEEERCYSGGAQASCCCCCCWVCTGVRIHSLSVGIKERIHVEILCNSAAGLTLKKMTLHSWLFSNVISGFKKRKESRVRIFSLLLVVLISVTIWLCAEVTSLYLPHFMCWVNKWCLYIWINQSVVDFYILEWTNISLDFDV